MNWTRTPDRDPWFIDQIKGVLSGAREVPAITYKRRGPELHLSDLDLCLFKTFYRLTREDIPPISDQAALKFARGRAIERLVGAEVDPIEHDGILLTPDGICPWGPYEFKSVNTDSSKFSPNTAKNGVYKHWTQRLLGYLTAMDTDRITLAIYFQSGNTQSHKYGMAGREAVSLYTYEGVATEDEKAENWARILDRKHALEAAINDGTPIPEAYGAKETWECGTPGDGCEMAEFCDHWRAW